MKRTNWTFLVILIFSLLPSSCGLETYVYLNPVEIVNVSGVTNAIITLPTGQDPSFRNYTIYYRIYLTDIFLPTFSGTSAERNNVNTQLASHFATLERYTSSDSVSPTSIDTVFSNLGYYSLFVSPDGIRSLPLSSVLNTVSGSILLDFTDGNTPTLEFPAGAFYTLFRTSSITTEPDRLFAYTDSLANAPISSAINSDVQSKTGSGSTRYAYVSMYILASGINNTYAPLYSKPSHIGIFQLPRVTP